MKLFASSSPLSALAVISASALLSSASAQGSWVPTMPGSTSPVFTPLGGFPRPGDPGQPSPQCPLTRQSGVFAFTDHRNTAIVSDDREYFVASRSEGIHLIDATPSSSGLPTQCVVPATNLVRFFAEPDEYYWGPNSANAQYPWVNADTTLHAFMNGIVGGTYHAAQAYCTTLSSPYDYSSKNTTNREAVVHYLPGIDRFFVYSVNTYRYRNVAGYVSGGIWIVPLVRDANGILQADLTYPSGSTPLYGWWQPANLGPCHTIYLDSARGTLWVVDDKANDVKGIQINADGSLSSNFFVYDAPDVPWPGTGSQDATAHDAMPVGNFLYVTITDDSRVDIIDLPVSFGTSKTQPNKWLQSASLVRSHSTYIDDGAAPQPSLWLLDETNSPTVGTPFPSIRRFARQSNGSYTEMDDGVTQAPYAVGFGNSPPSRVHHLRGQFRTGVIAHYNDGLHLADCTQDPLRILGSYDTSTITGSPIIGTLPQQLLDPFLGTWDVAVTQDSGLVYAAGGNVGGLVFRVNQGWLNRYWEPTPFPAGAASAGLAPRIVLPFGPPRSGKSLVVRDENAGKYSTANGTSYEYTLIHQTLEPTTPVTGWMPSWVEQTVNTNTGTLNVVLSTDEAYTSQTGEFFIPNIGTTGQRKFWQLVVEEKTASGRTGRWAASRGTWLGVAP